MQTVFRVKRHWDEKQAPGLKLAKRQRLDGEAPVILTYAGTTTKNDSRTVVSVIKSHQAKDCDLPVTPKLGETSTNRREGQEDSQNSNRLSPVRDPEIDELFKIYDAYQDRLMNLQTRSEEESNTEQVAVPHKEEKDKEFVYDIYYISKGSMTESMLVEYNERNYKLEHWGSGNELLVDELNEEDEDNAQGFEDEDSNAEDNPNNDYPDDEEYYGDDGQEVPHLLEDDDYYSYENYNHLTTLEQELRDLCFRGDEDGTC